MGGKIKITHKIELDPTAAQRVYFAKACGVARFSYNWALAEWERQYNAAINLKTLAKKSSVTACGDDVRLNFTIQQLSMKQEFETRKVG